MVKHRSTGTGSLKIAKLLVKNGANLRAVNKNGQTALYYAVKFGNLHGFGKIDS